MKWLAPISKWERQQSDSGLSFGRAHGLLISLFMYSVHQGPCLSLPHVRLVMLEERGERFSFQGALATLFSCADSMSLSYFQDSTVTIDLGTHRYISFFIQTQTLKRIKESLSITVHGKEARTKIFQIKMGPVVLVHKSSIVGVCVCMCVCVCCIRSVGKQCCRLKYTI